MPIAEPTLAQQSAALQPGWGFRQHLSDKSNLRVALNRVWRGYVLMAYQSSSSNKKVYFRLYDPYGTPGNNWLGSSTSAPNLITQSSIAIFYSNLTAYLIFGVANGNGQNELAYSYATQPATVPVKNNTSWDFTSAAFCNPQTLSNGAFLTLGPSVAPFGSNLWIAYGCPAFPAGPGANICCVQSPLPSATPGLQGNGAMETIVKDSSGATIVTISEPVLVAFAGGLYCFFVNTSKVLQYVRVDTPGPVVTVSATPIITDSAPGVTVDPTNSLVLLCYKDTTNKNQIMCAWSADLNTWTTPMAINQATSSAPVLYASNAGEILLGFRSNSDNSIYSMNPSQYWYLPSGVNVIPAKS